jgi:hypothetical protein
MKMQVSPSMGLSHDALSSQNSRILKGQGLNERNLSQKRSINNAMNQQESNPRINLVSKGGNVLINDFLQKERQNQSVN